MRGGGRASGPVSGRVVFMAVAGTVLALFLFLVVIQPAVARGGWAELALVAAIFLAVLGLERWLRTR